MRITIDNPGDKAQIVSGAKKYAARVTFSDAVQINGGHRKKKGDILSALKEKVPFLVEHYKNKTSAVVD